jgi:hypothetical protein
MSEITTTLLVRDKTIVMISSKANCQTMSDNVIFYVGLLLLMVNMTHFFNIFTNLFHSVRYQMTEHFLDFISFYYKNFVHRITNERLPKASLKVNPFKLSHNFIKQVIFDSYFIVYVWSLTFLFAKFCNNRNYL